MTWVETGQEAFDAAVIAYKVAEDPRVMLPCAVSTDGAFLTHSQHLVRIPTRDIVEQFLPKYDLGDRCSTRITRSRSLPRSIRTG